MVERWLPEEGTMYRAPTSAEHAFLDKRKKGENGGLRTRGVGDGGALVARRGHDVSCPYKGKNDARRAWAGLKPGLYKTKGTGLKTRHYMCGGGLLALVPV